MSDKEATLQSRVWIELRYAIFTAGYYTSMYVPMPAATYYSETKKYVPFEYMQPKRKITK